MDTIRHYIGGTFRDSADGRALDDLARGRHGAVFHAARFVDPQQFPVVLTRPRAIDFDELLVTLD